MKNLILFFTLGVGLDRDAVLIHQRQIKDKLYSDFQPQLIKQKQTRKEKQRHCNDIASKFSFTIS